MAEAFDVIDSNTIVTYTFRFGSSDKLVHLTQQQLDSIPYLNALLAHKDDMSSIQNENGEYILNPPIYYQWFLPILHSITSKNPYTLFNEVPEDNNILETLQLFDYLCIKSFPLPLLKFEDLVRSNPTDSEDQNHQIEYYKANLSEARQTAAEFVIALAKNEYELDDSNTKESVFTLIKVILLEVAIFSSRFRHHTLVVVKECVYSLFSKTQQHLLPTTQQIARSSKDEAFMYLYDDEKPLPDNFRNTLAWRGIYVPIEENRTDSLSVNSSNTYSTRILKRLIDDMEREMTLFRTLLARYNEDYLRSTRDDRESTNIFLRDRYNVYSLRRTRDHGEYNIHRIDQIEQNQKNNKAQSVQSRHYNKLPKRQNVDKLKYRFGPKTQKHR